MIKNIFRLLRRPSADAAPAPSAHVPPGEVVYAIGDIHGRADLLAEVADLIAADVAASPGLKATTVLLGDYVDRGPASAQVIETLSRRQFPTEIVPLRGNHEQVMLDFLSDPDVLDQWGLFGAIETIASYGMDARLVTRDSDYGQIRDAFALCVPASHVAFLSHLPYFHVIGDYFFCHAGVRPGIPLHLQAEEDLIWIREPFLNSDERFEKMIVHGHTPQGRVEFLHNRINIDTRAYQSGRLTCLRLEEGDARVLTPAA